MSFIIFDVRNGNLCFRELVIQNKNLISEKTNFVISKRYCGFFNQGKHSDCPQFQVKVVVNLRRNQIGFITL